MFLRLPLPFRLLLPLVLLASSPLLSLACHPLSSTHAVPSASETPSPAAIVAWPSSPQKPVSSDFWKHWGDGKAEISSYQGHVSRYGEIRKAKLVLIYVTEPMSRSTWIKSDQAQGNDRIDVLKLHSTLHFTTGIYPYSVVTSVFSPIGFWRGQPFSPAKITLTAQEWCGHVFHGLWPGEGRFLQTLLSYFDSEGEASSVISAPRDLLYEDALLLQLRQIDQPWFSGSSWSGSIVPSLWRLRKLHVPSHAVPATLQRSDTSRLGRPAFRYHLSYLRYSRTFVIEKAYPHRVLAWQDAEGEDLQLQHTERLPYWSLHRRQDEPAIRPFWKTSTTPNPYAHPTTKPLPRHTP